jgi:ribosomal protein S18 acetylase RimI-like enzyme
MIEKTHNLQGNALYVVSVGVGIDAQGRGVGGKLVQSQLELAKKLGLKYLFLGARAPGYDAYCKNNGEISAEEYLKLKNDKGETTDPEVRFYERQGLHLARIVPNFEPDSQSRDFGIVMVWENPQA